MKNVAAVSAVVLMLCVSGAIAVTPMQAAKAGADYLLDQQIKNTGDITQDGGWTWDNGTTAASNIAGPTAIGLVRYYNVAGGANYIAAAQAASDFISNTTYPNGEVRYSTSDPYFNWQLTLATGDNTYANRTKVEFFDTLAAGTYSSGDYDTAGWIGAVQSARTGTWQNLRPWEFSSIAVTADYYGNAGQADLFEQGILDGLNTQDDRTPDTVYSDLLGIAGGLRGLALRGTTTFAAIDSENHSGIDGISTLTDLADYMVSQQNLDGSWNRHSNVVDPEDSDKRTQTTAYAILALEAADEALGTNVYADEILLGRNWLITMQDAVSGGFYSSPGEAGYINNEVTGEVVAALVPEPASLVLLAMGGLALIRRR